jgi:hypothetical protein
MRLNAVAAALAFPLLLTACGTPQEQCIRANTRELRQVDALVAETEANLARGFGYQDYTVTEWDWAPCFDGRPVPKGHSPGMCWEPYERTVRKAVAIDPVVEKRKLAALTARRKVLATQAAPAVAACKAQYPE